MIPSTVEFTELSIDARTILQPRRYTRHWPADWSRHEFITKIFIDDFTKMEAWLIDNIAGRWGFYTAYRAGKQVCVLGFERVNDAIMFRLKDGDTAFREEK